MGRRAKLTPDQIREARVLAAGGASAEELGVRYGVSHSTIRRATTESRPDRFASATSANYSELGTSGLDRFGVQKDEYLRDWQTLDSVVRTVRRMLDHPIIAAVTFAVEMTLRSAKWKIKPASEDAADAEARDFLESCFSDMAHTMDDHLAQAVTMCWYGFAPFEIVYKRRLGRDKEPESMFDDGLVGWRKFAYRSPDTLAFGQEWDIDDQGGIQGMRQMAPPSYQVVEIPIDKLLLYRTSLHKNNPQGRSALRGAYTAWYFAKNLAEIEGISAERMGSGIPVVYLGRDTKTSGSDSDFAKAQKLVRNVRVDEQFGVVFPYPKMGAGAEPGKGVLFELISPPSRGIIDFNQTIERYNKQIAQVLLAQFIFFGLTQQGTQALAVRVTDFFSQALTGWSKTMAATINRFAIPRLFALNEGKFGALLKYPELVFEPLGQIDVTRFMAALAQAAQAGALKSDDGVERVVREILELPPIDMKARAEQEKQAADQKKAAAEAEAKAKADAQVAAPATAEPKLTSGQNMQVPDAPVAPKLEKASARLREALSLTEQATRLWQRLTRRVRRGS